MKLVLFDIDGTLIRDNGAARDAFAEALREVYGQCPELDRFDFSGRTDPEITWMVLEETGLDDEEIEEGLHRLWDAYLHGLRARVSQETVRIMPGIEALLEALAGIRRSVTLGLLTGNIEPGARAKLSPFDLNRYFSFGAFGSDSRHRVELPPLALSRAREQVGRQFELEDLVVIGDSIFDVRCTTPHGARSIAVATGVTPADTLRAERPDHFFDTLEDTERVVQAITA
ncbi:MAG: haloacid dehalogenase-like hydrolase [Thermoanaerobaculia bacterium]|nr:haloacid dehalogenase-like hydrolase [Thermoanaerobaculia bacterium]